MSDAGNEDRRRSRRALPGSGSFEGLDRGAGFTGGFDDGFDHDFEDHRAFDDTGFDDTGFDDSRFGGDVHGGDEDDFDDRFADEDGLGARVRPYAITGGRTRPVGGDLPVESLVLRTARGAALLHELILERRRIVELCERPLSVAEISAHVGVHLGVTQVLLGDLTAEGLVRVHSSKLADERPDIVLLERVLHGLKAL